MSETGGSGLSAAERRQQAIRAKILRNSNNRIGHVLGNVLREEINSSSVDVPLEVAPSRASPAPDPPLPPYPTQNLVQNEAESPPSLTTLQATNRAPNAKLLCVGWLLLGFATRLLLTLFPDLNAFFIFCITAFSLQTLRIVDLRSSLSENQSASFLQLVGLIFLDSRTNDQFLKAVRFARNLLQAFALYIFAFILLDSIL